MLQDYLFFLYVRTYARTKEKLKGEKIMCAPSSSSSPSPAPAPAPTPTVTESEARRTGKTLRSSSPSQRGRGVLIRSRNPLGIQTENSNLGTRQSLLIPVDTSNIPSFSVNVGGY